MSVMNTLRRTFLLALLLPFGAGASIINVDFNAPIIDAQPPLPPQGTHVGADGVLSTTGTFWNGVDYDSGAQTGLLDEFSNTTLVDLTILGDAASAVELESLNDLQETGLAWEGFEISNLLPGETYELVFYGGINAGFNITDLGGSSWDFCTNVIPATYVLPGLEGGDYCYYASLTPFDLGVGVMGLRVDQMDGSVMGFQISGKFPAPAPGFAKDFTPNPIIQGASSTLTFSIDNSGSGVDATTLDFSDNLPAGTEVASTPSASTSCTGGAITAVAGASLISYSGGSVAAGSSCIIQVDVTGTVAGDHINISGDLTSSLGNSGPAINTLMVTAEVPPLEPIPVLSRWGLLLLGALLILAVFSHRRYA